MKLLKSHKTFDGLTQFWEHPSCTTKTTMKFSTFTPAGEIHGAIFFLSGLTCTDENFISKAGAQQFLAQAGLMIICPDTSPRGLQLPHEHESYDFGSGAGFYVDATTPGYRDHYQMYRYVSDELHALAVQQFNLAANKISIMGHSMGGHGALIMALRSPEKFQSVSAFAPIVHPSASPWGKKAFTGYLGEDQQDWLPYDATELIQSGKHHPGVIYIDQGLQDEFLETQLLISQFETRCQAAKQLVKVNYREGYDHSYYFIASFIADHIFFHAAALKRQG
jgi:S-formylglutathione hydrolase